MAALFVLWLILFGGTHRVDCGVNLPETSPIFAPWVATIKTDKGEETINRKDGQYIFKNGNSTTTILAINMKIHQIGTEPDLENIAHNKRVYDCKTTNGEF